jgi:hypothetical protein
MSTATFRCQDASLRNELLPEEDPNVRGLEYCRTAAIVDRQDWQGRISSSD